MTTTNTYGRQVVLPMTNKSGGSVAAGDVVIVDTTNNLAFTTTTSASTTAMVGIAQETIANNATGRVLLSGYAALVNVQASVTRGHYGATYTVAKQATDGGASRVAGTFCQFLTGGTTPDAMVWPTDLGGGSGLTDPMTTRSDIIVRNASNVTARLAVGATANMALRSDGTDVGYAILPGTLLGYNSDTSGNHAVSGTSMADVDATNCKVTFTAPASTNVLVRLTAAVFIGTTANALIAWGLREASSDIAGGTSSYALRTLSTVDQYGAVSKVYPMLGISAGSHTYKWSHAVTAGAGSLLANSQTPAVMEVIAL